MRPLSAAALLVLAGCATPCPDAAPERATARYVCADGARLEVTFDRAAGRAFVSEDAGASIALPVQISGSGFRYADEGVEIRGRGDEALWTSPAGEQVSCRVVG
ncbi:MAG: MliC family protein [Hydrogenophilaceae bacterium]|jgi:membrane-bound inhibitor of C-type lysozyme|nr:MliC family protein [Hydrogenophilaceae bacterium]